MFWTRLPPPLRRPAVQALVITTISCCVFGAWALLQPYRPPWGGLSGLFADHFSHMNAARIFTVCGTCVWRTPVQRLFPYYPLEERWRLPDDIGPYVNSTTDIYAVPGWAPDKPVISAWAALPRPYPPGALVLAAPVAAAYHLTPLSFRGANRLMVLLYVLYAHVGLYFLLRGLLTREEQPSALGLLGGVILCAELVHWSLEGFYDVALLAPLVLCGYYLRHQRGLAALVCYCAAAFIHFRAYFLAPLAIYAAYLTLRNWRREPWGRGQWAAVAAVAVLGGASLYTFWLIWPALPHFPLTNPLRDPGNKAWLPLLLVSGVAAAALIHARAWLDVALLSWLGVVLSRVVQIMPWHVMVLMMWWALPVLTARKDRVTVVRDARVLAVWLFSMVLYGYSPLPPQWIEKFF
jgi:hypothetical protein